MRTPDTLERQGNASSLPSVEKRGKEVASLVEASDSTGGCLKARATHLQTLPGFVCVIWSSAKRAGLHDDKCAKGMKYPALCATWSPARFWARLMDTLERQSIVAL